MAWQIGFLYWLAHVAVSAFLLLAAGCLAMRPCRQPVRRLRLAELTLLGSLLAPGLYLVPGLPHYALGWLEAVQAEPASTVDERPASAGRSEPHSPIINLHQTMDSGRSPVIETSLLIAFAYIGLTCAVLLWWLVGVIKLRRLYHTTYPAPATAAELLEQPGVRFINGVQGDVFQEKQEDGRWRTEQMLPDEEVEVTVSAKGYKSHNEKLKLAEGTTKELAPVLEKE